MTVFPTFILDVNLGEGILRGKTSGSQDKRIKYGIFLKQRKLAELAPWSEKLQTLKI